MGELSRVVANEWMKLLSRRRFWLTGLLALLTVGLFALVTYHDRQNQLRYNPVQATQSNIVAEQSMLHQLERQPKSTQRNQQMQSIRQQIAQMKVQLKNLTGMSGSSWRAGVQTSVTQLQAQIDNMKAAPKSPQNLEAIGQMQMQLLQNQYSLAHNTNPNQGWTQSAYQYINSFLDAAAQIFLPLLVVILVADMVSGEATDGTIKLLLVRPVSRVKILLGKWLVSLLGSVLIAVAFFALMWLVAIAIAGPSGAGAPILVGVHYTFQTVLEPGAIQPSTFAIPQLNHAVAISQLRYFIIGGLFTLLPLMAVATLALFCSTWFKSAMASTAVALGAIIIGFILTNMARRQTWVGWLFPTHLNLWQNWSGQLSLSTEQNLTLAFGLWVLLAWSVAALSAALWRFARRDILNA